MLINEDLCSLRFSEETGCVEVIDQTRLPHTLDWIPLDSLQACCHAISTMQVRGAPLIGIAAAFGLAHALARDPSDDNLAHAQTLLLSTRPTAVNLRWALEQVVAAVDTLAPERRAARALELARELRARNIDSCEQIGVHGLALLRELAGDGPLNIMTHCNAGWLAAVRWGTALAPVYKARESGLDVHVWVSETRPRNQGMNLTAWELERAGVSCTVVADNSCGQLMRQGRVDCVLVGGDRIAANGDVCNKVGTYLKALAAHANEVPFYVALPASTIDWSCPGGEYIPIEQRDPDEVLKIAGRDAGDVVREICLSGPGSAAHNPAFDVTPAALVTALVTEYGSYDASEAALATLRDVAIPGSGDGDDLYR